MAWSDSRIFVRYLKDIMDRTAGMDLDGDSYKVALYNNSITPDRTVASASTGFNTGQWATANEITDATNWVSGGRTLAGVTWTPSAGVITFDANDLAGGGTLTLAATYGCLVYDDTIATPVADQGACFNYFGGANQVTSGTFTIVWNASGIYTLTV